ncbi:CysE Serine acetyltransferase [Methylophilaceae bacterium]|jgi:sugar O-acyltransferase (sialic acid O-acetyltransferase NeuD family)
MRQAVILGTGGHCRVVLSVLKDLGSHHILDILELAELRPSETILDFPVNATVSNLSSFCTQPLVDVFLAIGDNLLRREWWYKVNELKLPLPNLISPYAIIDPYAELGEGNVICAKAFIGPECKVGNNNIINTGATLEHEAELGSHCHLSSSSTVAGRSCIHDDCFIGVGATIIDNITIASKTTLGAGAVLITNIDQSGSVYVGVPAKKLVRDL